MKSVALRVFSLLLVAGLTVPCVGCKSRNKVFEDSMGEAPMIADNQPKPHFQTTASGLRYRVLREGPGRYPRMSNKVTVHYKGWLDDMTTFDSSYGKDPISFPLSGVIKGWGEGMQLVGEGGMIELEVPPELGYGQQGAPGSIPPNARLHFLVELISVE